MDASNDRCNETKGVEPLEQETSFGVAESGFPCHQRSRSSWTKDEQLASSCSVSHRN
jgi:hypothetical protein